MRVTIKKGNTERKGTWLDGIMIMFGMLMGFGVLLLYCALYVGIPAAVLYIIWHFLHKYW